MAGHQNLKSLSNNNYVQLELYLYARLFSAPPPQPPRVKGPPEDDLQTPEIRQVM